MNYSEIKKTSIENGPGVRVSLFVSGCRNHCKGCFQPETWDFNYGQLFTPDTLQAILEALEPSYISGLSILGGDPMEYENQGPVLGLCKEVKSRFPNKTIWLYTGYQFESYMSTDWIPTSELEITWPIFGTVWHNPIYDYIDVMVDGKFEEDLKDLTLRYRGSSNQRIIDIKKSKEKHQVILWEDPNKKYNMEGINNVNH